MSMSTEHGGGSRRPSAIKAIAGGKPYRRNQTDDNTTDPGRPDREDGDLDLVDDDEFEDIEDIEDDLDDEDDDLDEDDEDDDEASGKRGEAAEEDSAAASGRSATATKRATAAKKAGTRPGRSNGRPPRRPVAPVRVRQERNWGPIALFTSVVVIAVAIIGFAGWKVYENGLTVAQRVERIDGAVNYLAKDKNIRGQVHAWGPLRYPQSPPIGGRHNPNWQNCMGEIYDAPIAAEHAVHSLEHGAVWITYNPAKVNQKQIDALAAKIRGKEYAMMSPYEGLDHAVSVQAWGFQLKVNNPSDGRIDEFIKVTRKNASVEAGATCSNGITETGTTPRDLGKEQEEAAAQQQQTTGG